MAKGFWYCNACGAQNSHIDGECQYCECEGLNCKRENCSEPQHFLHFDALADAAEMMTEMRYFDEHCVCDCQGNGNDHTIAEHRPLLPVDR